MQSVYIETTIPSYLTARPSKQQMIADDQLATVQWWDTERKHYRLFSSIFTTDEAAGGDSEAARLRLDIDYCGYHQLHFPIICTPRTLIELRTP